MSKKTKKIIPQGLFSRFLLIVTLPIIFAQFVGIYMFYYRHWSSVSEDISSLIVQELQKSKSIFEEIVNWGGNYEEGIKIARIETGFDINFIPDERLKKEAKISLKNIDSEREEFYYKYLAVFDTLNKLKIALKKNINVPFAIYEAPNKRLIISLQLNNGIFEYNISKKRIVYASTYIFTLWVIGVSVLMIIISVIFLRNQIKSIKNLTKAAQKFGRGGDAPNYKPTGAKEIRSAGLEFIRMRDRIKRQIAQRTEMLACVSHDLRTPLTRMKLQLELMKNTDGVEYLKADISDMEEMINEYLNFTKGNVKSEERNQVDIVQFVRKIVNKYKRVGSNISFENKLKRKILVNINDNSFKRVITNLVDNAFNHGTKVTVLIENAGNNRIKICIEDNGSGVKKEDRYNIFKPFFRCDTSRNLDKIGTGLGLAIVKDIIVSHGGSIKVEQGKILGGAKFVIQLPFEK